MRILVVFAALVLVLVAEPRSALAQNDSQAGIVPVWDDHGQIRERGAGYAIAATAKVVVTSGNVCSPRFNDLEANCGWLVRAHNAKTGARLWEDYPPPGKDSRSVSVAIDGGRAFVAGWLISFFSPPYWDFVVRGYDLDSGRLLWQQRIDRYVDSAAAVTAHAGRVFAVGHTSSPFDFGGFAVFAFDAQTGAELWAGDPNIGAAASGVATDGDRVFVVGSGLFSSSLLVRAFDAKTGNVVWEDEVPGGFVGFGSSSGRVVAQDGLAFIAGGINLNSLGDGDSLVRAYDQKTGAVVWSRQLGGGGLWATQVVIDGDRLFAVTGDTVRAFDPEMGAVLWQNQIDGGGFTSIAANNDLVFVAGSVPSVPFGSDWVLRTYDAESGRLRSNELLGPSSLPGPPISFSLSSANAIVVRGGRLYATGMIGMHVGVMSTFGDYTTRAYSITGAE